MPENLHKVTRFQRRADGTWVAETPDGRVLITDGQTILVVEPYVQARKAIQTRDNPDGHGITVSDLPG